MFEGIGYSQDLADVYVLNKQHLISAKEKIQKGDATMNAGYDYLIKNAEKAMKNEPYSVVNKTNLSPSGDQHDYVSLAPYFWPDPKSKDGLPYIRKDGVRNPEVEEYQDRNFLPDMAADAEVLSLAYFFSGDEKYAIQAAKLIKVFFLEENTRMNPNLNYAQAIKGNNDGRGAGLIESRHFIKVIESVKFLEGSVYWTKEDDLKLKKWFADFLKWMQTSPNGMDEIDAPNNHGTWYDAQRLSFALYSGDMVSAKAIANNAIGRLDKQMDNDGSFPKELERTIALHYSSFNLYAFFIIAELAEKADVDLWNVVTPSGKSLKKGFDYIYPFLSKEKKWKGQQIKAFDFTETAPFLMKAAVPMKCNTCSETVRKYELKEDNLFILKLVCGE
jgi:hypothetical protein